MVLCLLRDGMPHLETFVEHHFALGAEHLVFLDNGSTDGTIEALKEYDNVTVLRTRRPYRTYQVSMKQYLAERFGQESWTLYADVDELFDYPYSDTVSLKPLLGYLNDNRYTAVVTHMLDVFPEDPLSEFAEGGSLKERHRSMTWRTSSCASTRRPRASTTWWRMGASGSTRAGSRRGSSASRQC